MSEDKTIEMANFFCSRLEKLKSQRSPYETVWQDIMDYTFFNRQDFFSRDTIAERRDITIYDTTAVQSNQTLASALHGGLTSTSKRWFDLIPTDGILKENDEVKKWTETALSRMFSVFNSTEAGFVQQNHEFLLDIVSLGTAALYVDDVQGDGIKFRTIPLSEIFIAENSQGTVDTVFRSFEYTARQASQEWGEKALGDKLSGALDSKPDEKFEFLHAVLPRKDAERKLGPQSDIPSTFDFIGFYISISDKKIMDIKGFYEQPYIVARWEKLVGEDYGRSPGWNALADTKMINKMSEITIRSSELAARPPLLVADDGVMMPMDTTPDGVIMGGISDDGRDLIKPLMTGIRLEINLEMAEQRRDSIRRTYFVDQFTSKEGTPVTATEFAQRTEDRLRLTGPQLFRLRAEYLSKVVDRVFNIMSRNGDFPDIPEVLNDVQLDIEYISPLVKSQRFEELAAFNRTLESIFPLIESDPSLMDNFNGDWLLRTNAEISGIPASAMRKFDGDKMDVPSVQEVRGARQQQQEQQQQQQQMMEGADAVANLKKSGVDIGV